MKLNKINSTLDLHRKKTKITSFNEGPYKTHIWCQGQGVQNALTQSGNNKITTVCNLHHYHHARKVTRRSTHLFDFPRMARRYDKEGCPSVMSGMSNADVLIVP